MEVTVEAVAMIFYTKMLSKEKKNSFSTNSIPECLRRTCFNSNLRREAKNFNSYTNLDHIKLLLRNYSSKIQGEGKA